MTHPLGESVPNPTYIWTFLVATPGSWQPAVLDTDQGMPGTKEELNNFLDNVSGELGVPVAYIRPLGAPICLHQQPFEPPKPASQLIVPNGKLIVPGRDVPSQ
jgi:hypothetical protein